MSNFDPANFAAYRKRAFNETWEFMYFELSDEKQLEIENLPNGEAAKKLKHQVESHLRGIEMEHERQAQFAHLPDPLRETMKLNEFHPKWDDIDEAAERSIADREEALERWAKAAGVEVILL